MALGTVLGTRANIPPLRRIEGPDSQHYLYVAHTQSIRQSRVYSFLTKECAQRAIYLLLLFPMYSGFIERFVLYFGLEYGCSTGATATIVLCPFVVFPYVLWWLHTTDIVCTLPSYYTSIIVAIVIIMSVASSKSVTCRFQIHSRL